MSSGDAPQPGPPGMDMGGPWGNLLNDPAIMELAQKLQEDPSFRQMQEALQHTFAGAMGPGAAGGEAPAEAAAEAKEGGGESGGGAEEGAPAAAAAAGGAGAMPQFPGLPGFPGMDPSNAESAMSAMQQLYSNPSFMEMAQKIGESMLQQNPVMKAMMDPSRREAMQAKFEELKKDPEIAPIMTELESGNPQAMMKYWNNPDILTKFSEAVQDVMGEEGGDPPGGEDGEAAEGPPSMQQYAGEGNLEGMKQLAEQGVGVDDADEEGRTGLHFACGYGEMECVKWFLEKGAKLDSADSNKNTALHYAAGYGQVEVVALLLEKGADISSKNEDGNTSREVAELNEKDDIVKLLEGAMKDLKI